MRIQKIAGKESKLDLDAQHTQIDILLFLIWVRQHNLYPQHPVLGLIALFLRASLPRVDGACAGRRHPRPVRQGARSLPRHCGEPQRAQASHGRAHLLQGGWKGFISVKEFLLYLYC